MQKLCEKNTQNFCSTQYSKGKAPYRPETAFVRGIGSKGFDRESVGQDAEGERHYQQKDRVCLNG